MAQDIRKMFQEEDSLSSEKMEKGHQQRFEARLDKAFPREKKKEKKSNRWLVLQVAAILLVFISVGFVFLAPKDTVIPEEQFVDAPVSEEIEELNKDEEILPAENAKNDELPVKTQYRLSDVSPEFKQVEDFYLASLNIELAKLEVNDENRALVDSFMTQLAELDKEYQRLNAEITETGLTESSVEAMINNLQLRLELLYKLKNKIKDINTAKNKNYENQKA